MGKYSNDLIVGELYRPPNTNATTFLVDYELLLSKLNSNKIIIEIDQHLDYLKIHTHNATSNFFDFN